LRTPGHSIAGILLTLLAVGLLLSCRSGEAEPGPGTGHEAYAPPPNRTLFYPSAEDGGGFLTAMPVHLDSVGGEIDGMVFLVRRYLEGPVASNQVQPFPEGTGLRALFLLEEGVLVVDLSGPARTGGGTQTETSRVYGLVDTLCWNFPDLDRVQILVEGQEVPSLLGHLSLSRPIPPDEEYLAPDLRMEWRSRRGL